MEDLDTDKLVKAYIKIRDARAELKRKDDEMKADMAELETMLLDITKQTNSTSINTTSGTVIRSVETRYWAQDWDAMHRFIKEHDALHLMEKRIAQKNMADFLSANPELLPEGLNSESKYAISVRRK